MKSNSRITVLFAAILLFATLAGLTSCSVSRDTSPEPGIGRPSSPAQTDTAQSANDAEMNLSETDDTGDTGDTSEDEAGPYIPDTVIPISIYDMTAYAYGYEAYGKIEVLKDDMSLGRDLCCVAVFLSDEELLDGADYATIWNEQLSMIENDISGYRTGFRITYSTSSGKVDMPIMKPDDIKADSWEYLEEYIYDDVQGSSLSWYSHLLPEEFVDSTNVTSLKVTAGPYVGDVTELYVTAFLYTSEEADMIYSDPSFTDKLNHYTVQIIPNPGR